MDCGSCGKPVNWAGDAAPICWTCNGRAPYYREELTPAGPQLVIPGCERQPAPENRQLSLFA